LFLPRLSSHLFLQRLCPRPHSLLLRSLPCSRKRLQDQSLTRNKRYVLPLLRSSRLLTSCVQQQPQHPQHTNQQQQPQLGPESKMKSFGGWSSLAGPVGGASQSAAPKAATDSFQQFKKQAKEK